MKIHNNQPVTGKGVQKAKRSSTDGVFGKLLDTEIEQTAPVTETQSSPQPHMKEAWHTLEESVTLLDEAMSCIEAGDSPPQQLIHDIENLRSLLRQQVAAGHPAAELTQADTLLAVEAERIRSMQS